MKAKTHPLRSRIPERNQIPSRDAYGRAFRGRAADIRRLYAEERCSLQEIAAFFGVGRHVVSWVLRGKSSDYTRQVGLRSLGRGRVGLCYSRNKIVRAANRWLTKGPAEAESLGAFPVDRGEARAQG